MLNIIDKEVTVKTSLGVYKGKVLFYNGGNKITLLYDEQVRQILSDDMVITVLN
jgi:hypothetical protein